MTTFGGVRKERVIKILNKACEYYGVDIDSLLATQRGRLKSSDVWRWKRYLVLILYENTGLVASEIQSILGYKQVQTVLYHIERLKDEISEQSYGSAKTKRDYNELVKFLEL